MKQWDLSRFHDATPIGRSGLQAKALTELTSKDSIEDQLYRLFGLAFIALMPQAGLREAVETLKDIWIYYSEVEAIAAPPRNLPVRVTLGHVDIVTRPEIEIPGDDE